jgi:predicted glycosyltransferase involved in capsule biosynthesis
MLEVLIPVKGRDTIAQTVKSLIKSNLIDLITIITGDPPSLISEVTRNHSKVRLIDFSKYPFHKSFYLNMGIEQSLGDIILISDADIIWNLATIEQLSDHSRQNVNQIVHVANVEESQPQNYALKRPRLTPIITQNAPQDFTLKIAADSLSSERPGCGLICTHRQTLLHLGGYNSDLKGWGWEDQDLLIRAQLLGYQIMKLGSVLHLSHPESLRNPSGENPLLTRDLNIRRSCQAIARGKRQGSINGSEIKESYSIKIELP